MVQIKKKSPSGEKIKPSRRPDGTFLPGQIIPGFGGENRREHARNRLSTRFIRALADDFEECGVAAIKALRMMDPGKYLSIIAALEPKELKVSNPVAELTDDELTHQLKRLLALDLGAAIDGREAGLARIIEGTTVKESAQ